MNSRIEELIKSYLGIFEIDVPTFVVCDNIAHLLRIHYSISIPTREIVEFVESHTGLRVNY